MINYENIFHNLVNLAEETSIDAKLEFLPFPGELDKLLITNYQRDEAIKRLQGVVVEEAEQIEGFYSLYSQCNSCQRWYCKKHNPTISKCIYC